MPVNCWEAQRCGREPGGQRVHELGVCRAAIASALNGVHGGRQGGRACWVQAGTFCGGTVQGSCASKLEACSQCSFYQRVKQEEGNAFLDPEQLLAHLGPSTH